MGQLRETKQEQSWKSVCFSQQGWVDLANGAIVANPMTYMC
jgi:hypothetical protein